MKKAIAVIFIIMLVVAGCGGQNEQVKQKPDKEIVLKKSGQGYSIKGLRLKMNQQQVIDIMGKPNSVEVADYDSRHKTLEYDNITVRIADKENKNTSGVYGIIVNNDTLYADKNINIGASIGSVKQNYGEPYKIVDNLLWYVKDSSVDLLFFEDKKGEIRSWGLINKWYLNE